MKLTIKEFQATGVSHPTFGDEYMVEFIEHATPVKMSRKTLPVVGEEVYGEIKTNSYGAYFKKDDMQPTASGQSVDVGHKAWSPMKKDNSDGQRQGMCINNAANYINTQGKLLTADEWAKAVHSYGSALYRLGDLSMEQPEVTADTLMDFFGKQ